MDTEKRVCSNCKRDGLGKQCPKLLKKFEELGISYKEGISTNLNLWSKQAEVKGEYTCQDFDSMWIEYPLAVSEIKVKEQPTYNRGFVHVVGTTVKVRPCSDNPDKKTFLGIYLGDLPRTTHATYNRTSHEIEISQHTNPAMWVPTLNKIIFGDESWWQDIGMVPSEEDLKDVCITDSDIENQWYMKAILNIYTPKGGNDGDKDE